MSAEFQVEWHRVLLGPTKWWASCFCIIFVLFYALQKAFPRRNAANINGEQSHLHQPKAYKPLAVVASKSDGCLQLLTIPSCHSSSAKRQEKPTNCVRIGETKHAKKRKICQPRGKGLRLQSLIEAQSCKLLNKKPTRWCGRKNATPPKFDPKPSEAVVFNFNKCRMEPDVDVISGAAVRLGRHGCLYKIW